MKITNKNPSHNDVLDIYNQLLMLNKEQYKIKAQKLAIEYDAKERGVDMKILKKVIRKLLENSTEDDDEATVAFYERVIQNHDGSSR